MGLTLDVCILGVNEVGQESGNSSMCQGRVIPWLQDTQYQLVWQKWNVTFRDVVILNQQNVAVAAFNLTTYDLGKPANYDSLKTLLSTIANNP